MLVGCMQFYTIFIWPDTQELDMEGHADGSEERLQECHHPSGRLISVGPAQSPHDVLPSLQTLKSAIGMKESEESSGLASPKLR